MIEFWTCKPESVLEKDTHKILWYLQIKIDRPSKPEDEKSCQLMDFADHDVKLMENEKVDIAREGPLKHDGDSNINYNRSTWNNFKEPRKEIKGNGDLGDDFDRLVCWDQILRRVIKTWEDLLTIEFQWRPPVITGVKPRVTVHKDLPARDEIKRIYVSRKEGGWVLASIEDCVDATIKQFKGNSQKRTKKTDHSNQ